MSVHSVYIVEQTGGGAVQAELHDDLSAAVLLDIETQWAATRQALRQRLAAANVAPTDWPQSLHWDWSNKSLFLSLYKRPDSFRVLGIRRQAAWEGVMVTLLGEAVARLDPDCGKCAVYVDYLETAPWNWTVKATGQVRKFRAVGSVLLKAAVATSRAVGCDGRLVLHALPQADDFYVRKQFRLVKHDAAKKMNYYELTAEAAQRFERG
jgi:hypothetical protein